MFLLYSLGFLALYTGVLVYTRCVKKLPEDADEETARNHKQMICNRRQVSTMLLLAVMVIEIICNLINFGLQFEGTSVSNYPRGTTYTASVIRYMKEREARKSLFFRAETTHSQTLNDGALNGYNGVSAFTSSANVKVTEFMQTLGYGAKNTYNRYCHEEASPVSNLFLNLKYAIERQGKDKTSAYFEEINRYGNTVLLENKAYLPLGFLAESELGQMEFDVSGVFVVQNRLFSSATGIDADVWRKVAGQNLTITGNGTNVTDSSSSGYCAYKDSENGANVVYTYAIDQDGFMCVHLNLPKRNGVVIRVNGFEIYSETTSLPQMMAVGDVQVGDEVEVVMSCKENESGTMTLSAGILNMDRFWRGYEKLKACPLELTVFSNTRVEGTIDCDRDGLLYTSIPQNGNWSAFVDGKPAEIRLVGDAMVAVELDQGTHTVEFRYENPAFSLGWKISLGALVVFGLLVLLMYKPAFRIRRGKYER